MSAKTHPAPPPATQLLQRIREAVEPPKRQRAVEIACAVLLALTTPA